MSEPSEINFKKLLDLQFSNAGEVFSIHAASGLVKIKEFYYVISDDEKSLFKFSLDGLFESIVLQGGTLPHDPVERKKVKPDWEALAYFSSELGIEGILVIPSGSKSNRQTGFFVHLGEDGQISRVQEIDFSALYEKLQSDLEELNIEGGVISGAKFKLLQRGNGKLGKNAIIDLDLKKLIECLVSVRCLPDNLVLGINFVDLGKLGAVPLGFTDGFVIDECFYFLAVAENTDSTYEDGQFMGAVLGKMKSDRNVGASWRINCTEKPEGLWMEKSEGKYKIFLVTDADSRENPSSLFVSDLI